MIKDYEQYNERMAKTLFDKAFFIDKIYGAETVVDFGCADGSLIEYLNELFPTYVYIGYDNDEKMIDLARSKVSGPNIIFVSSLENVKPLLKNKKWAINFSSVLHEIDKETIEKLAAFLEETKPTYMCVRDMNCHCFNLSLEAQQRIRKDALWEDYAQSRIISTYYSDYIEYLLKRTYIENWEKEKQEHYFSGFHKFENYLRPQSYKTIWEANYCLPYQLMQWKQDFGFDYAKERFTTHKQLIVTNIFGG